MQIVAYIPARDSSTRLPLKNISDFNGKTLVARTIDQARKAKVFDRLILSSNSDFILNIGKDLYVETLKREDKQDKVIDVLRNDIPKMNVEKDFVICILFVTCPLREPDDIVKGIELFKESDGQTVVSVKESENPIQMAFKKRNGHLIPMMPTEMKRSTRKQDHEVTYFFNDAFIIDTVENFMDPTRNLYGEWPVGYIMPWERSVAIDYEFQLRIAKLLDEENVKWRNLRGSSQL